MEAHSREINVCLLLDKMLHNQTIGRNRDNIKSFTSICKEVKLNLHNKNISSFIKALKWS